MATVLKFNYWRLVVENRKLKSMIRDCDQRLSALKKEVI